MNDTNTNTKTANDGIDIQDAQGAHRYELRKDGELAAFIGYRMRGQVLELVHTEVLPQHEGGGVGSRIARHALDDARARGLKVMPSCSFIAAWIERHPDYGDLVAG